MPADAADHDLVTRQHLLACCDALDDKKAERLVILEMGERSSVADYFVIATGTSSPHLKALREALRAAMKEHEVEVLAANSDTTSGWLVVDAFDFVVHLFTEEMRDHYRLEALWKDAPRFSPEELRQDALAD